MSTPPVRAILVRYAAIVAGLPFLFMFVLGVYVLLPQIKRQLAIHQQELAAAVGTQVETYLESAHGMVAATAADVAKHGLQKGKVEDYLLTAMLRSLPQLRAMYVVDAGGHIVALARREGTELSQRDLVGADLSRNSLIRNVLASHSEQWSDNYLSIVGGGIVVALGVPCATGVMVGELELGRLSQFLKKIQTQAGEEIFLLDSRAQVISARDTGFSGQQVNLSNIPLVKMSVEGASGATDVFSLEGHELLGSTRKLPAMKWIVLVAQPQEYIYRQFAVSGKIAALGLSVALGFAMVFAVAVARAIARRFEALVAQAAVVAAGTGPATWPKTGILEFNNLAENLQRMSDSLHERTALLEQEIGERQNAEAELREKNEELAAVEEELRQQVDELLQAQEELAKREEEFRTVSEWTYDWEYWISPDRSIRYISPSCERVSGFSPAEFIADPRLMERIIHPEDRQVFVHHLGECLQEDACDLEETSILQFRIVAKDGAIHWLEHVCRPVFATTGAFLGRRASNRDITERRLLEHQILQQQKLEGLGLLAGGIAHDFNNMLTPIVGYAEMIKAKTDPAEKAANWANSILGAADKARSLIKQLLSFSRKQVLAVSRHDLNTIVSEFSEVLRRTIRESIEITHTIVPGATPVEVDRTQIEQVLLNLAVNAQDAIAENGTISIETSRQYIDAETAHLHPGAHPGRYVVLSFTDSGCGMEDAIVGHIFEPFFTTKGPGKGTGLGLSTSYGIIQQHNGFLDVVSTPGQGTCFRIFLPEAKHAQPAPEAAADSVFSAEDGSGTILVVEDNLMVLEMMRDLLQSRGYSVLSASLPDDALEMVRSRGKIDLLVSDVVMPQMSGPEMFDRLAGSIPGLKALFVSGYATSTVINKDGRKERVDFLSKPFSSEIFLTRVEELLRGAGS